MPAASTAIRYEPGCHLGGSPGSFLTSLVNLVLKALPTSAAGKSGAAQARLSEEMQRRLAQTTAA